jgi:SH3-like domain-containing protein
LNQPARLPTRRFFGAFAFAMGALATGALTIAATARAADFRATSDAATLLYDGPSTKARPVFVYGRDVPLEVLVTVEGWTKVRDATGTIGWMANKSLADKHILLIRAPIADVRAMPDEAAPVVFRAEKDVLVELAEAASSPATTAAPGWVKVRHRDGQIGFVRLAQVFGF